MTTDRDRPNDRLGRAPAPLTPEELAHWRERAATSPDVRMTRVLRMRRAIADGGYEARRIDRVVDMVGMDLARLWAADSFLDYPGED